MITVGTIVKFIDSGGQKNAGLELINCIKALNNIEVTPKQ